MFFWQASRLAHKIAKQHPGEPIYVFIRRKEPQKKPPHGFDYQYGGEADFHAFLGQDPSWRIRDTVIYEDGEYHYHLAKPPKGGWANA